MTETVRGGQSLPSKWAEAEEDHTENKKVSTKSSKDSEAAAAGNATRGADMTNNVKASKVSPTSLSSHSRGGIEASKWADDLDDALPEPSRPTNNSNSKKALDHNNSATSPTKTGSRPDTSSPTKGSGSSSSSSRRQGGRTGSAGGSPSKRRNDHVPPMSKTREEREREYERERNRTKKLNASLEWRRDGHHDRHNNDRHRPGHRGPSQERDKPSRSLGDRISHGPSRHHQMPEQHQKRSVPGHSERRQNRHTQHEEQDQQPREEDPGRKLKEDQPRKEEDNITKEEILETMNKWRSNTFSWDDDDPFDDEL